MYIAKCYEQGAPIDSPFAVLELCEERIDAQDECIELAYSNPGCTILMFECTLAHRFRTGDDVYSGFQAPSSVVSAVRDYRVMETYTLAGCIWRRHAASYMLSR